MRSDLMAGVRVIDLSTDIAWDCARMLASFGAEVIRVDPPEGLGALRAAGRTVEWQVGQSGKTCMTLDYRHDVGKAILADLIAGGDILIESFAPGVLAEQGLDYAALSARTPGLVQVSITPFGQEGPYADYKAGELVVAAMSSLLGLCGDTDRPPVREPRAAHLFHACAAGVAGAVFALRERERSGLGQRVEISAQEVGASRNTAWILASQFDGRRGQRRGQYLNLGRRGAGNRTIWRLKDGYAAWQLSPPSAPQTRAFAAWMAELGYPGVDSLPPPDIRVWEADQLSAWEAALGAFLADRTRAELMEESDRRGCDAAAVSSPAELAEDPQYSARGYFGEPEAAIPGAPRLPQYFIRTSADSSTPVPVPTMAGADA